MASPRFAAQAIAFSRSAAVAAERDRRGVWAPCGGAFDAPAPSSPHGRWPHLRLSSGRRCQRRSRSPCPRRLTASLQRSRRLRSEPVRGCSSCAAAWPMPRHSCIRPTRAMTSCQSYWSPSSSTSGPRAPRSRPGACTPAAAPSPTRAGGFLYDHLARFAELVDHHTAHELRVGEFAAALRALDPVAVL